MKSQILDDTYDGKEDKQTELMLDCLLTYIDDAKVQKVMSEIEKRLLKNQQKQDILKKEFKNLMAK